MKLKLVVATVILVHFIGCHGYTHPSKNKLVNIQELLLLTNLTILYASSYHSNSALFSTVSNVMISLALFQFCIIILYHFLTYTCQCDVVGVIKTIKEKLLSKKDPMIKTDLWNYSTFLNVHTDIMSIRMDWLLMTSCKNDYYKRLLIFN